MYRYKSMKEILTGIYIFFIAIIAWDALEKSREKNLKKSKKLKNRGPVAGT